MSRVDVTGPWSCHLRLSTGRAEKRESKRQDPPARVGGLAQYENFLVMRKKKHNSFFVFCSASLLFLMKNQCFSLGAPWAFWQDCHSLCRTPCLAGCSGSLGPALPPVMVKTKTPRDVSRCPYWEQTALT